MAAALGIFVDKEAHKTFLQVADNQKQTKHIRELHTNVNELTEYGEHARQLVCELRGALEESMADLMTCDNERIALLNRETTILERAIELKVENTKLQEQNKFLAAQLGEMAASLA